MTESTYLAKNQVLPEGFSYLHEFNASIHVNIRYATSYNFYGGIVPGYEANVAIGTQRLIESLANAQNKLEVLGFGLVVYEVYRPMQAGLAFYEWAQSSEEPPHTMQESYFPLLKKKTLFEQGYIARKSAHTRGSAVDLTLIQKGQKPYSPQVCQRVLNDGRMIVYLEDGTCDMGTHFDFLDEASHCNSSLISTSALHNRATLDQVMVSCGLQGYSKEWWHYQLVDEVFPDTYFDFPVR